MAKILITIIRTLPIYITVTQAYEWETLVTLMREQEWDTREETFAKVSNEEHKLVFQTKENKQKRKYHAILVVVGILQTISFVLTADVLGYSVLILI